MKKNKSFSLAILTLIIIAFLVTYISISSYISLVSANLTKSSSVVSKNYETYETVTLNNMNESVNMAKSTLVYLSTLGDKLTTLNEGTSITDFSVANLDKQSNAIAPSAMYLFTKQDVEAILNNVGSLGDVYSAFSSISDGSQASVLFYCDSSDYFKKTGYYLLTLCSEKSSYYACCGFYDPTSFLMNIPYSDVLTSGSYSIYSSECIAMYSYDFSTKKVSSLTNLNVDDNYDIISSSGNMDSIVAMLDSHTPVEFDVRNIIDNKEYHLSYAPVELTNCDSLNLYTLVKLPNTSGIDSNLIKIVNDKGNTTTLLIVTVFFVITIMTLLIQYNYQKKQDSFHEKLEIESKRYLSIIGFAKWLIWEYNFTNDEIAFLSSGDSDPLIIAQYKNRMIRENLILNEDISLFDELMKNIQNGSKNISAQFRIRFESSDYRWFEFTGHTITDASGKPVTAQIVAWDIDDQKKQLELAKTSSERDPLTGVFNLNAIKDRTLGILSDTSSSLMHAFILVDFDNFSSINENYGQTFGDAILIDFTSKLSSLLGANDLIGRVGADKFIIFLHSMPDIDYANDLAHQILSLNFFDNFSLNEDSQWKLTSSIGIAIYPNHGDSFEALLSSVDIALYHAKMNGRNCCVMYNSSFATTQTGNDFLVSYSKDGNHVVNSTIIDNDLVFNASDLLFSTNEINVSLPMTLSLIGNHYNLDQVGLIEFSEDGKLAVCKYSWNSKSFERFAKNITTLDIQVDDTFHLYESNDKNIFYTNKLDLHNITQTVITDIIKCSDIQSIFQCGITDNGITKGYLFAHSTKVIDWPGCISDTLTLLTKIVTGCIMKQHSEEDVRKLIKTDILTGSDNISSFVSKGTALLEENPNAQYAMIYMDINKFKLINDKYGYSTGDKVIIHLSNIIADHLSEDEIFARADADKFILMIHFNGMSTFDKRLMGLFNSFTTLIKNEIGYRSSLIAGVYLIQDREDCNISSALDRANIARKSIKEHHNTTYEVFNESMKKSLIIKNDIENSMEAALENEEFLVYYQPKINIFTNKICGSEALVRWNRPGSGLISPALFIPVFEENGFVVNIDYYVFDKVCETLRRLMDEGVTVYPVSVNFSRVHLKNNKILRKLEATTKKYNIDPSLIEVEITESALSEGDDFTPTILNAIKNLGFKLSMDDFGCGLSSLNSLRKFPFDILKLDKEFFNKDGIEQKDQIVVQNVVTMAKQLNMSLIAEGIETPEQVQFLRTIECPVVQGYVYSPPITEERFINEYLIG